MRLDVALQLLERRFAQEALLVDAPKLFDASDTAVLHRVPLPELTVPNRISQVLQCTEPLKPSNQIVDAACDQGSTDSHQREQPAKMATIRDARPHDDSEPHRERMKAPFSGAFSAGATVSPRRRQVKVRP
jgi:hypothetical protein